MSTETPAQELREAARRLKGGAITARMRPHPVMVVLTPETVEALADWLGRFGDELYCYGPAEFDHALAIARAYLGTGDLR